MNRLIEPERLNELSTNPQTIELTAIPQTIPRLF